MEKLIAMLKLSDSSIDSFFSPMPTQLDSNPEVSAFINMAAIVLSITPRACYVEKIFCGNKTPRCVCVRRAWLSRMEGVSIPACFARPTGPPLKVEVFNAADAPPCSAALDLAALPPEGVADLVRLQLRVAPGGQVLGELLCKVTVRS